MGEPATQEFVLNQVQAHAEHCNTQIDRRIMEIKSETGKLWEITNNLKVQVATVDERTKEQGVQLLRIESRQAAGNAWAIATLIGVVVSLVLLVFSIMKELALK